MREYEKEKFLKRGDTRSQATKDLYSAIKDKVLAEAEARNKALAVDVINSFNAIKLKKKKMKGQKSKSRGKS
jgi:hypothetical protein